MSILNAVPSQDYDVLIIGSGPAGLTTAIKIAEKLPLKIAVVESGGDGISNRIQALSDVTATGDTLESDYFASHSLRCLGGTSRVWQGFCSVFEKRSFDAGEWPIGYSELTRYYPEAAKILEIPEEIHLEPRRLLKENENLQYKPIYRSPPVRFHTKYRKYLVRHETIDVLLNKTVVRLVADGRTISSVLIRDSVKPEAPAVKLAAKTVIVACGGTGTPRLLLLSGVGTGTPVGNYFMCHPHVLLGKDSQFLHLDKKKLDDLITHGGKPVHSLQMSSRFCVENNLLSIAGWLRLKKVVGKPLLGRKRTVYAMPIYFGAESLARRDNRVFLGNGRDYLGQADTRVEYRYRDQQLIKRSWNAFARELLVCGFGRATLDPESFPFSAFGGHHIGTTRMGSDPNTSVVDRDCKLHSVENLYIAGSSLFPASGYSNPTFTIVALAIRLAEHVVSIHRKTI